MYVQFKIDTIINVLSDLLDIRTSLDLNIVQFGFLFYGMATPFGLFKAEF